MHRNHLLQQLNDYRPLSAYEDEMRHRIISFVKENPNCFERSLLIGHITASALIVNPVRTHTLLTHHLKLEKWLQLGGHADGDSNPLNVALREAEEESGIAGIVPISENIFDVDVHPIPARHDVPEHFHYDIRFLFQADDSHQLTVTPESKELAWIPLNALEDYTTEESMLRMIRKVRAEQ